MVPLSYQHPRPSKFTAGVVGEKVADLREERATAAVMYFIPNRTTRRDINVTPKWCKEVGGRDECKLGGEEVGNMVGKGLLK